MQLTCERTNGVLTDSKLANQSRRSGLGAVHVGRKRWSELSARSVTSSVGVQATEPKVSYIIDN